jgi:hypothetical protein
MNLPELHPRNRDKWAITSVDLELERLAWARAQRLIRMGEQARRLNEEARLDGANAADAASRGGN